MITTKNPLFVSFELESDDFLAAEEAHHALHVLRLKESDTITIIDGKGLVVDAVITKTTKKELFFHRVKQYHIPPDKPELHLVVAPTKNIERYEFMIEKCTEIGFTTLTPIICRKSERREVKVDRLERIAVAAVKQSMKAYIPKIENPMAFFDFVKNRTHHSQKYIALCQDIPKNELFEEIGKAEDATIIVGPEGDFSPEEIELALSLDFKPVMLGKSRLRTETAGIVACHTFSLKQQHHKSR